MHGTCIETIDHSV